MLTDRFDARYYGRPLVFKYRPHWYGGAFSRTSAATTIGRDGLVTPVASGIPRIAWMDLDGDGVRETPTLRLEPSRTNLLLQSSNVGPDNSPWAGATEFSSVTPAASIFQGQTAWRHTNGGAAGSRSRRQSAGQFGSGQQTVYVVAENVNASQTALNIRDATAGVNVCIGQLSWATGGANVQLGTGTVRAEKLADAGPNGGPVYLLAVTATGTPGNDRQILLYPTGTSQNTDTAIIHHVQLEEQPFHTSPIVTTTAPVTRAADALSFPLPASLSRPVPMTVYLRFVERGAAFAVGFSGDILEIGDVGAVPLFGVDNAATAGIYRVLYSIASGVNSTSEAPIAVAIGDVVELAAVLTAAGAARIRIARNGGAEQAGPLGPALGLAAAPWPVQTLRLRVRGQSPLDVIELKVATGEHTIADIRSM